MNPIKNLVDAIFIPFKAVFVVGLCWVINAFTYSGTWWVKWVALGMGLAVIVKFAKAAKTLLLLVLVGWVGWKIYQRYGQAARERFEAWVQKAQPQAAEVMQTFRSQGGANFAAATDLRH